MIQSKFYDQSQNCSTVRLPDKKSPICFQDRWEKFLVLGKKIVFLFTLVSFNFVFKLSYHLYSCRFIFGDPILDQILNLLFQLHIKYNWNWTFASLSQFNFQLTKNLNHWPLSGPGSGNLPLTPPLSPLNDPGYHI